MTPRATLLVGCGAHGTRIATALAEFGSLDFCDEDAARRSAIATLHPTSSVYESLSAALAEPGHYSSCIIATDPRSHYVLAREAIEAGLDVLIEKPVIEAEWQLDALSEVASANKRIIMAAHQLVYSSAYRWIAARVRSGIAGRLLSGHSFRLQSSKPSHCVDQISDLSPHDLAIVDLVIGLDSAQKTLIHLSQLTSKECYRSRVVLSFAEGMEWAIESAWNWPKPMRSTILFLESEAIVHDELESETVIRDSDNHILEKISFPNDGIQNQFLHFMECCATRAEPITNINHIRRVLRFSELTCEQERKGMPDLANESTRFDDSNANSVETIVIDLIISMLAPRSITPGEVKHLTFREVGLDSLDLYELIIKCEETFQIMFPTLTYMRANTPFLLAAEIEGLLTGTGEEPSLVSATH